MKEVFLVSSENKDKAENILRTDDLISRQSIIVRSAPYLDIDEEGYFIIIDGSEAAIKMAHKLLDKLAKRYEHKEKVIAKVEEQENAAIEGFGNILDDYGNN